MSTPPVTGPADAPTPLGEAFPAYLEKTRWFGGKGRPFEVSAVTRLGRLGAGEPVVDVLLVELTYGDAQPGAAADVELYQVPLACYREPEHRLDHAFVGWWEDAELGWVHAYDALHDRTATALWLQAFAAAGASPDRRRSRAGRAGLPPAARPRARCGRHGLALHRRAVQLLGGVRRGRGAQAVPQGDAGAEPRHHHPRRAHRGRLPRRRAPLRLGVARRDPPRDAAGVPAHRQRRLGPRARQRAQPVRRLHPRRRGGRPRVRWRLLRRVRSSRRHPARGARGAAHPLPGGLPAGRGDRHRDERAADQRAARRARAGAVRGRAARPLRRRRLAGRPDRAARPRRPAPRPDAAHRERVEDRRLRGRARQDARGTAAARLAWRDVAGMLRSFAYAPHVVARQRGDLDDEDAVDRHERGLEWAARNQRYFVAAYAGGPDALGADDRTLLTAYVADKAVYETVYETRNRPTWVEIPLAAIARIGES